MSEKDVDGIEELIDKWKASGYDKNFLMNFKITYNTDHPNQEKWPIVLWDREGWPCKTGKEDFQLIVGNSISHFGLTQLTLWDTYREHGQDISVSTIRREDG